MSVATRLDVDLALRRFERRLTAKVAAMLAVAVGVLALVLIL